MRTDLYILRQFAQTFLFGVMAFVVIYVIVDLIENLETYTDRNLGLDTMLLYYLYYIPEIAKLVVPIGMLLAGLFTFGRLDSTHELTAIRVAGRSMRRIAAPLILFGLFVSGVMVYFNGWVVPQSNAARFEIDREFLGRNNVGGASNTFMRVSPTLNLQIDYFDSDQNIAHTVSLERIDTNARLITPTLDSVDGRVVITGEDTVRSLAIVERIDAARMTYDSTTGSWKMIDGIARNMRDPSQIVSTHFNARLIEGLPLTPEVLFTSQQKIEEMTAPEVRELVERERMGGRDVTMSMVNYYSIFAYPFAAFVVVFFGIPFSSAQRKGGAAVPIAMTALISAVYLIFTEVSKTLSVTAGIPPLVTAWLANAIFFLFGILNLWRVER